MKLAVLAVFAVLIGCIVAPVSEARPDILGSLLESFDTQQHPHKGKGPGGGQFAAKSKTATTAPPARNTQTKLTMADGSPVPALIQSAVSTSKLPTPGGQLSIDWLPPTATYLQPGPNGALDPSLTYTANTAPFDDVTGYDTVSYGPGVKNPQTPDQKRRARAAVLRSMGHAFDYRVMNDAQRQQAEKIMGVSGKWLGDGAPFQVFADLYAFAAQGHTVRRGKWQFVGGQNTVVTARKLAAFKRFVHDTFAAYVRNGGKLPGDDTLQS